MEAGLLMFGDYDLVMRLWINLILIHSKRQTFPRLKFKPGGISVANSPVEWFELSFLSEDISAERKC